MGNTAVILITRCSHSIRFNCCLSKCGPWTGRVHSTWELVRKADNQAPPGPTESGSPLTQIPQVTLMHVKAWEALFWGIVGTPRGDDFGDRPTLCRPPATITSCPSQNICDMVPPSLLTHGGGWERPALQQLWRRGSAFQRMASSVRSSVRCHDAASRRSQETCSTQHLGSSGSGVP